MREKRMIINARNFSNLPRTKKTENGGFAQNTQSNTRPHWTEQNTRQKISVTLKWSKWKFNICFWKSCLYMRKQTYQSVLKFFRVSFSRIWAPKVEHWSEIEKRYNTCCLIDTWSHLAKNVKHKRNWRGGSCALNLSIHQNEAKITY